jgi:anti-sigma B factor antagonist
MKITKTEAGGTTIIAIEGEVNIDSSQELHNIFTEMIDQNIQKVIVDLELTSYIDSSGLATLVYMSQALKGNQGKIMLANILSDKVRGIFEITKLDKVFKICNSREEALAAF